MTDVNVDFEIEEPQTLVADIIVEGSNDHNVLINRGMDNQHPISAITGLEEALDGTLKAGDNVSELNNDVGYITSSQLPTNYVTTDTNQTIGGTKTFSNSLYMSASSGGLYAGYNNSSIFEYSQFSETFGNAMRSLTLTGYGEHPAYEDPYGTITEMALMSDIPTTASDIGAQEELVSGVNIKTINNQSLLGSGNINIQGGGGGSVDSVNGQTGDVVLTASDVGALSDTTTISDLTTTAQQNAIDSGVTSADVALAQSALQSGDNISELVNDSGYTSNVGTVTSVNNTSPDGNGNVTLTIPAAQVNSDWNAVSGVAEILNKPSLATVATSGAYSDLTGTPTVDQTYDGTSANAQSGVAVAGAISGKANDNAVVHLAGTETITGTKTFSSSIGLSGTTNSITANSGDFISYTATTTSFGSPIRNITLVGYGDNPAYEDAYGTVTSIALMSDIASKENKVSILSDSVSTTITEEIQNNCEYRYTQDVSSLTITLPQTIDDDFTSWVVFNSGSTATSIVYPNTIKWSGDDVSSNTFVPVASTTYNVAFWYDGINVNAVVRGV